MPLSAPPPSWASIKSKPTTIAGFGITDVNWTNVASKPTTVAGLGLSDFNASAIAAQASASAGGVGTYAFALTNAIATNYGHGATLAGSSLLPAGDYSAGFNSGTALTGTWRCMGNSPNALQGSNHASVWLRIS